MHSKSDERGDILQFYETQMGRVFFQGQLPKLIGALEGIAAALRTPAPVYQVPLEVSPDFLSELYYGGYDPSDEPESEEWKQSTKKIMACQKTLRAGCSEAVWEQIEDYRSLLDERGSIERAQAFSAGVRIAMRMVVAGLSAPKGADGQSHELQTH